MNLVSMEIGPKTVASEVPEGAWFLAGGQLFARCEPSSTVGMRIPMGYIAVVNLVKSEVNVLKDDTTAELIKYVEFNNGEEEDDDGNNESRSDSEDAGSD